MMHRLLTGAGLILVLGLSACQSNSNDAVPASQAGAGGDSTAQVAACTGRMASELGVQPADVTPTATQLNGDGSQTIAMESVRGDRATCTAAATGQILSFQRG